MGFVCRAAQIRKHQPRFLRKKAARCMEQAKMPSRKAPPRFDCLSAMRALGEPTRLRLVRQLIGGAKPVTELCESLGATAYNVSKHLRVLKEAGLLEVEKQGQQRIYDLAAAFREKLSRNSMTLDLGCCQFHFDKLPE